MLATANTINTTNTTFAALPGLALLSNSCGSAPVTSTPAMYALKPPIIMERLRLSKQQREDVVKHASLAQASEVSAGDIVYQCEVSSDLYQYLRWRSKPPPQWPSASPSGPVLLPTSGRRRQ